MNNILKIIGLALGLALFWLALEAAWTVHELRPKLAVTITNIDRATIAAGAAAGNVEKASRAWKAASEEQASQTTKAMSSVSAAAEQLTQFISRTDNSLNSQFIPSLQTALQEENAAMLESQKSLQSNLESAQKVLLDADKVIADPAIKASVDNLSLSVKNTAEITGNVAATTESVKNGVDYEVKQIMAPVSKVKMILLFVVKVARTALGW